MSKNRNLKQAKKAKNDEFYTQYADIEKEVQHYTHHFENKVVYCNCDDYRVSNFAKYFDNNFDKLKLKKLIVSGLGVGSYLVIDRNPAGDKQYTEIPYSEDKPVKGKQLDLFDGF